ncbi:MAG: sodium/proton-translocating pyrophosphatase [Candidatus Peribacteraceae bacterium]|nr:sodium/proton-translocating pyrophosphatase [Candidatus Peribacteraceae bacterium]
MSALAASIFPFSHTLSNVLLVVLLTGILALVSAMSFRIAVGMRGVGTQKMQDVALAERNNVTTLLGRVRWFVILLSLLFVCCLYAMMDGGWGVVAGGAWPLPMIAGSFLFGVIVALVGVSYAARAAHTAQMHTAQAARVGLTEALRTAFLGGSITGFVVVGSVVVGMAFLLLLLMEFLGMPLNDVGGSMVAFVAGASIVTLVIRLAGGAFLQGASLAGADTRGAAGDAARTSVAGALLAGDTVVEVVGGAMDLLQSMLFVLVTAFLVGSSMPGESVPEQAAVLPFAVIGLSIISSIFGTFVVRTKRGDRNVQAVLKNSLFFAATLLLIGSFFLCHGLLATDMFLGIYVATITGLVIGIVFSMAAEYATSEYFAPVRRLAAGYKDGLVSATFSGVALGTRFVCLLTVLLIMNVLIAFIAGGFFGVTMSMVGMISLLGVQLAIDASCCAMRHAGTIAESSDLPKQVCARTNVLRGAGDTLAAAGRVSMVGIGILSGVLLLISFSGAASFDAANAATTLVVICLLLGAAASFAVLSALLRAGRTVARGWLSRSQMPRAPAQSVDDGIRVVRKVASGAVWRTGFPLFLMAVFLPIILGMFAGSQALGAFLLGFLISSGGLALAMIVSGGAFRNALRHVEEGNDGGEGSVAYRSALITDALGVSLGTAVAPTLIVFLKTMLIVSLLFLTFFTGGGML